MTTHGRKPEEKLWDTSFRHVFNTNYLKDPDLHVLLFVGEAEVNNIIRQALRDYMLKHKIRAADPEFQAKVFMNASMQMARGVRPVGSEVLAEMGELPLKPVAYSSLRQTPVKKKQPPSPVIIPAQVQPAAAAETPSQPVQPAAATSAPDHQRNSEEVPVAAKRPLDLDFGAPDPEFAEAAPIQAPAKPSARDRWLAQNAQSGKNA